MSNARRQPVTVVEVIEKGAESHASPAKRARRRRQRQRRRVRNVVSVPQTISTVADRQAQQFARYIGAEGKNGGYSKNFMSAINTGPIASVKAARTASKTLSQEYACVQGAIVAPQVVPPERYSTAYASNPTAVANPWTVFDYPWASTDNTDSSVLGASELFVCAFRDPLRSLVYYDENEDKTIYEYQARLVPEGIATSTIPTISVTTSVITSLDIDIFTACWTALDIYAPHGNTLYCGSDEKSERTYRWFDDGELISFGGNNNLSISGVWDASIFLDKFQDDALIEDAISNSATANSNDLLVTCTIPAGGHGYYAIRVTADWTAGGGDLTYGVWSHGTGCVFCHNSLPNFQANQQVVDGVRVVGISAMYSNNAALIQKSGTVTGLQAPQGKDWYNFIGPLSVVSRSNNSKTFNIQDGIYGFLKPVELEDFKMLDYFATDKPSGILVSSGFPLRATKSFLILRGTVAPTDGRSGYITFASSVEYATVDVWRTVDIAKVSPDVYQKALEELKYIVSWHENPTHFKEIFSQVLSGAKKVVGYAQKYAPVASSVLDLLSGFLA